MSRCLAISASAGSGKTFQLAHRYIGLLLHDVEPDRIIALTFSRKAAAEIFDSIVKYLVQAVSSPAKREELGRITGFAALDRDRLLELLRGLLARLHRLQIGTLDSFAVRLLSCFPLELGIDYGFELIDNDSASAKLLRRDTLLRLMGRNGLGKSDSRDFIEAFRLATFGREERRLSDLLQQFIAGYQELYLQMPDKACWGSAARIWPVEAFWQQAPAAIAESAAELRALVERELPAKVQRRWLDFAAEVEAHRVGRPLPRALTYLLERIPPVLPDLLRGEAEMAMERVTYPVRGRLCRLLLDHVGYLLALELDAACQRSGAIYEVVRYYEELYDRTVRRRGQLTFDDVHFLLGPGNAPVARQYTLSRQAGVGRLFIDYRLDARIDHWLLDEFQDTSDLQWQVLANLVDEVVQDRDGGRSFFYVGDVKQAIYRWRRGNADLFGQILRHYGGEIRELPLDRSFRSCQPIIDCVNAVFGALPDRLPERAVGDWRQIWRPHACAAEAVPAFGHVALLEPPHEPGTTKPGKEDRYALVAALLMEMEPIDRNLSVAVLVRKNSQGRDLVQYLRANCPALAVVHEGMAGITDNPVCSLLLNLVRYAVHPGNSLAGKHLQMSPLDKAIRALEQGYTGLPLLVLSQIRTHGFRGCLAGWGEALRAAGALDRYGEKKLVELLEAAEQFDLASHGTVHDFPAFIEGYRRRETAAAGTIQVMTVHQSKGLGFDVVVLPELQDGGLAAVRRNEVALVGGAGEPASVLAMPVKVFAEADPVLAGVLADQEAAAAFDELCTLYVAMTRAKKALYLITSFPGKTSSSFTPASLLKVQLARDGEGTAGETMRLSGCPVALLYEAGDRQWFRQAGKNSAPAKVEAVRALTEGYRKRAAAGRLSQVSPSGQADQRRSAAALFSSATGSSLSFGSAVHSLFEELGWYEPDEVEAAIGRWLEKNAWPSPLDRETVKHFRQALAVPAIQKALCRPSAPAAELWRERQFEVIVDGAWVSGIFDRVVLEKGENGDILQATVQDYKTNRFDAPEALALLTAEYAPQMELYRRALAILLGIDPGKIALQLLFSAGEIVQTV